MAEAIRIMNDVAESYGVSIEDLRSRSRVARLATARAVACYMLVKHTWLTTTEVGQMLFRDHSAVSHNCRVVEGFYLWPKMYATDLAIIKKIEKKYKS